MALPDRSTRAARALGALPQADPALAALALWCRIEDGDGPTATAGSVIRVGPEFPGLPLREQIGLIGHHVLHVALRHAPRMQAMQRRTGASFDRGQFNLAADALTNEILYRAELALPRPAVDLAGVLESLVPPAEAQELSRWDVEQLYHLLQDLGERNRTRIDEYMRSSDFAPDLVPDYDASSTSASGGEDSRDWEAHIARALQAPGARGRGVGRVLQRLLDLAPANVPWERRLRGLVTKALLTVPSPSFRRPRHAWIAAEALARAEGGPVPVFQPALRRDGRRPRLVVAVDTSGSVPQRILHRFAGEIGGITRRSGAEVHLLCFDEEVYDQRAVHPGQINDTLMRIAFRREGGTSFIDPIRRAATLDPSAIVLLTDLEGPAGTAPTCPVIWAVPHGGAPKPPFGQALSIDG
jgi:predicted metal-dependent peptidase